MTLPTEPGFFDDNEDLWLEINGKLPGHLMVGDPAMFMVEHDEPGRVYVNLTRYICRVVDARAR
jgi:uncharacterized protein (UPF0548 family)